MKDNWSKLKTKIHSLGGACLMATLFNTTPAAAQDALTGKASLQLVDATSIYSQADLATYYPDIAGFINFPCFEQKFVGDFLISAYSNLATYPYGPLDPVGGFLTVIINDVSNNTLVKKSELRIPHGKGVSQVSISPVANRPLIAVSTYSNLVTGGPYTLDIYTYDENGIVNQTPVSSTPISSFNPKAMDNILTFAAATNFTPDGKYLFYTQTLDNNQDGTADEQVFGILKVSADGTTVTPAIQVPTPNGKFFCPQPDVISFKNNQGIYKIISAYAGFTPGVLSILASDGCVASYDFDPKNNTLVETGYEPIPGLIQGYDLNPDQDRLVLVTAAVSDGKTIQQNPTAPYPNNSEDPGKSFRLYSFNKNASSNALSYLSGHDFDLGFWSVRWSHDGKYLAATANQKIQVTGYVSPFAPVAAPAGLVANANCPSLLMLFTYKKNKDKFKLLDIKPGSAYSNSVIWSKDDKLIGVSAQSNPDLKDLQLYQINE